MGEFQYQNNNNITYDIKNVNGINQGESTWVMIYAVNYGKHNLTRLKLFSPMGNERLYKRLFPLPGITSDMERDPAIYRFYKSPAWKKVSKEYAKSVGGLCERCLSKGKYIPGEIVHHKIHVTPDTIGDAAITLNTNNLELVCRACHAAEHPEMYGHDKRRYTIINGKVVPVGE